MRAVITALAMLPLAASAQVYIWKDASGKTHYSDRPPAERGVDSRKLGASFDSPEEVAAARKAAAEKRMEATKRGKDAEDAAGKAEKEQAANVERQKNCDRAKSALAGLESGQVRFRLNDQGEREALDDNVREAELAAARKSVESWCTPQAATTPAPVAPKKTAPGY